MSPVPPECLFGDILEFYVDGIRKHVRHQLKMIKDLGRESARRKGIYLNLRDMIPAFRTGHLTRRNAFCYVHQRSCCLTPSKVMQSGTPCVGHSSIGLREEEDDVSTVAFMAWVSIVNDLEYPIVVHENVEQFPAELLDELLGCKYHITTAVLDATSYGYPIRRRRRYTVMVHRRKAHKPTATLAAFANLFTRQTCMSWHELLIATNDQLLDELRGTGDV